MQIGYGDPIASDRLQASRQNYRDILESILRSGVSKGVFLSSDILDIRVAIDSIIGTINWSIYNITIVENQKIEPEELAEKLSRHLLRSLIV